MKSIANQMAPAIVEPYNAILSTHTSLESVDVCFLVDNQVGFYEGFHLYHGIHLAGHLRDLQEEPPSGSANLHQPQSHHRAGEGGSNVNTWKTAPQR